MKQYDVYPFIYITTINVTKPHIERIVMPNQMVTQSVLLLVTDSILKQNFVSNMTEFLLKM